jgi:hypothetical protein
VVESKGLFGRTKDKKTFSSVPIRFGKKRVVFVPREQLELSADVVSLSATLGGEDQFQSLVISETDSSLIGLVFEGPGPAASLLPGVGPLDKLYMPTLIAVRNGTPLGVTDRLRRVGRHYFPFERDRLTREGARSLRFRAQGFRGTGDFAEYLVRGDQVVDLEGNLVGIVTDENRINVISLSEWKEMPLSAIAKN